MSFPLSQIFHILVVLAALLHLKVCMTRQANLQISIFHELNEK